MNSALMLLMRGAAAAGGAALTPTYLGSYTANSSGDNVGVTTANVNFGEESPDRTLFVVGAYSTTGGNRTLRSIRRIGGVDATTDTGLMANTGGGFILRASVPTGTSGTIEISYSAVGATIDYHVYSVPVAVAIVDAAQGFSAVGSDTIVASCAASPGGFALAAGFASGGLASSSGLDNVRLSDRRVAGDSTTTAETHSVTVVSNSTDTIATSRLVLATYTAA